MPVSPTSLCELHHGEEHAHAQLVLLSKSPEAKVAMEAAAICTKHHAGFTSMALQNMVHMHAPISEAF